MSDFCCDHSQSYGVSTSFHKPFRFTTLLQAILLNGFVVLLTNWGTGVTEWKDAIAAEYAPVERISAALWFMGMVWCGASAIISVTNRINWLILTFFMLLLGLRELDAHIWITGWNLDKLANYWNPAYPLHERIMAIGLFVIPSVFVAGIGCIQVWKKFLPGWSQGEGWIGHMMVAILLLVLCLVLDKVGPYVLPDLGVSPENIMAVMALEEFLECLLATYAFVALWPYCEEAILGPP